MVELSIVIPTHRRASSLRRLLASLKRQSLAAERFEVIVVSNLRDRASKRIAEKSGLTRLRFEEVGIVGVNRARNHGLAAAVADIVYFIDDDCELLRERHLEHVIDAHRDHPEIAAVGGPYVLSKSRNAAERAYGAAARRWMSSEKDGAPETWRLVGGNVAYKRKLLSDQAATFDPSIVFGGSETELHARLDLAGHRALLLEHLAIAHHCRLNIVSLFKKGLHQGNGARKLTEELKPFAAKTREEANPTDRIGTGGRWQNFHSEIYRFAFTAGFAYVTPEARSVGRLTWRLALHVMSFGLRESLRPIKRGVVVAHRYVNAFSRRAFWGSYNFGCRLTGALTAASVSAFWSVRRLGSFVYWRIVWAAFSKIAKVRTAVYWATHRIAASAYGRLRTLLVLVRWRIFHAAVSFIRRSSTAGYWQFVHPVLSALSRAGSRTYWSLYAARGRARMACSILYWMGHRAAVATKWRMIRIHSKLYWLTYRLVTGAQGFITCHCVRNYWRAYRVLSAVNQWRRRKQSDLYWKYIYRVVHQCETVRFKMVQHGQPATLAGAASQIARYALFRLREIHLEGSKVSRFLHQRWRARQVSSASAVLVGAHSSGEFLARAETARRFGFRHLIFDEAILSLPDLPVVIGGLSERGFELEVFVKIARDTLLPHAHCGRYPPELNLTAFVAAGASPEQIESCAEFGRIAIASDVGARELDLLKRLPGSRLKAITMTDLESRPAGEIFDPRDSYRRANEIIAHRSIRDLSWNTLHIYRPFDREPVSPLRFLDGERVLVLGDLGGPAPEWSVIIPCFQAFEYLPVVLRHIFAQDYPSREIEVIVVDDGSPEALHLSVAAQFEQLPIRQSTLQIVRIGRGNKPGETTDSTFRAGVARNAGIARSRGKKILFLDADILVQRDHLQRLDRALERYDVVQIVRHMLAAAASTPETDVSQILIARDTYREDPYWENFKHVENWNRLAAPWKYVCTYALCLKRETLDNVHLFRPEFCEYGFEDTELGFRLFREGYRFHLLRTPVFHLFPVARSWAVHFDEAARRAALKSTANLFYQMHRDPSIYYELESLLVDSTTV